MAKPEGKATGSGTYNYAGMSAEDVAWIQKKIRRRQEQQYGSFNFSFNNDSSFIDDEETGLFKECPLCCGPCNVKEFLAPALFDPLDFTLWWTLTSVPRAPPTVRGRPIAWPSSTSLPYPPAFWRQQLRRIFLHRLRPLGPVAVQATRNRQVYALSRRDAADLQYLRRRVGTWLPAW
jgi:hypothetical protein